MTEYDDLRPAPRLLHPIGQPGRPPRPLPRPRVRRRERPALRPAPAPACNSRTSGRTSPATWRSAGSTCRARTASGSATPTPTSDALRFTPAFAELLRVRGRPRPRRCSSTGRALVARMPRALAVDVDLFSRGGLAILDRIETPRIRRPDARGRSWASSRSSACSPAPFLRERRRRCAGPSSLAARGTGVTLMSPDLRRELSASAPRVARREARNFYPSFLLLPADRRRSMCALYAFMRQTDDLADEPGTVAGQAHGARRLAARARPTPRRPRHARRLARLARPGRHGQPARHPRALPRTR